MSTDTNDTVDVALAAGHRGTFFDDDFSVFEADIEWIAAEDITKGCNPPVRTGWVERRRPCLGR